jgi:hypothetical protein
MKYTPHPYQPNVTLFDWMAVLHEWALSSVWAVNTTTHPQLTKLISYGHGGGGAVTWHRRITGEMEHLLQIALDNTSFAIPYWNFTGSAGSDNDPTLYWFGGDGDVFSPSTYRNDPIGANADDEPSCRVSGEGSVMVGCWCGMTRGPFQSWPLLNLWAYPQIPSSISRAFGCQSTLAPSLPSQSMVDWIVNNQTFFGTFLDGLGGGLDIGWPYPSWPHCLNGSYCDLHLRAHRYLAGTMVGTNPGADPLFYLLHAYADLVFERWIRAQMATGRWDRTSNTPSNEHYAIGQSFLECQGPFYPPKTHKSQFIAAYNIGFTYDRFEGRNEAVWEPFWRPSKPNPFDPSIADAFIPADGTPEPEHAPANSTKFFASLACINDTSVIFHPSLYIPLLLVYLCDICLINNSAVHRIKASHVVAQVVDHVNY